MKENMKVKFAVEFETEIKNTVDNIEVETVMSTIYNLINCIVKDVTQYNIKPTGEYRFITESDCHSIEEWNAGILSEEYLM